MGTRGFVGFVANGRETITYNQFDSYPSGIGVDILAWLRKADTPAARADIVAKIVALVHVDDDQPPTEQQREALARYSDTRVSTGNDWYAVLRNTHGDPAAILEAGLAEHLPDWPADSLFCEWGYLIDTDAGVLEVYAGFQHGPHTEGRFHDRGGAPEPTPGGGVYYPVKRIASWPLTDLPTDEDFLAATGDS